MCKCSADNPEKSCEKCRGGRPSKYDSIDLAQVKILSESGWTDRQMFSFFNVGEATWFRWKNKHPEFRESIKNWKEKANQNVVRSLYERACGYSHEDEKVFKTSDDKIISHKVIKHYPPDVKAQEIWLRNRDPKDWNVSQGVDMNVTDVKLIPPEKPEVKDSES